MAGSIENPAVWPYADIAAIRALRTRPVSDAVAPVRRPYLEIRNRAAHRHPSGRAGSPVPSMIEHVGRRLSRLHHAVACADNEQADSEAALIGGVSVRKPLSPAIVVRRWAGCDRDRGAAWFAPSRRANGWAGCFWSAFPSLVSLADRGLLNCATGRRPTRSITCRRRCCMMRTATTVYAVHPRSSAFRRYVTGTCAPSPGNDQYFHCA